MRGREFFEGVRTVLVDKNDKPKWQFKTTKDVPDSEVAKYFAEMSDRTKELII